MQFIIKAITWLLGILWRELTTGGWEAGQTLPGKGVPGVPLPIPRPYIERTRDRAKALATENKVLQNDAKINHEERADELRENAEVKNEDGQVTGYRFNDR